MEKLKQTIKQMNKKQKEICVMAIVVIIFIVGRVIYLQNSTKQATNNSNSNTISKESTSSKSSSSTSTSNNNKVTTSYQAISYAKDYTEYGLASRVKSSAGLHSLRRLEITDTNEKDRGSYYEVTLKGNGSGYSDSYDTKFKTLTFDAKVEVNKKTGRVSIISVSARTK